jgi:hypothetical protein
MRPADLAAAATRPGGTIVTPDPGSPAPLLGSLDTAVVIIDVVTDVSPVAASLEAAADGARVVVLLPCGTRQLPVGRLVDVLARHGGQAVAVVPVDDRTHPTALVVERGPDAPPVAWLASRGLVDLDPAQLTRRRAELVVGGSAEHANGLAAQSAAGDAGRRAAAAEARATTAEAAVTRLEAEVRALRTSRSYEVGQALAEVRTSPVGGLARLPGRLRRAGKGSTSA